MLLKVCRRCGAMVQYPRAYCDVCQPIVEKQRAEYREQAKREADRSYNKRRDPKYLRFYGSTQWKILSAKYQQDKGYKCERCGAMATEVHHKEPIQTPNGWERRLDYDNLEALCVDCHNYRHKRFKKRQRVPRPGRIG